MRRILLFVLLMLLPGCATSMLPQTMRTGEAVVADPPQAVTANPRQYLGRKALWGGRVVAVRVAKDYSELEVLQVPLDDTDRPLPTFRTNQTGGRFLAKVPGLLDPQLYASGREVTVLGSIETLETRPLGEQSYTYPVLGGASVQLWKEREPVQNYYMYDPMWDYRWRTWGPAPWGPYYR